MSILKKLFRRKDNTDSYAYHLEEVRRIAACGVKYVTEYVDGNDNVVGRGGSMAIKDEIFIIDSSGKRLFMCPVKDLGINHLMSGNGVMISGSNMLEDGNVRVLTVHFVYYRK